MTTPSDGGEPSPNPLDGLPPPGVGTPARYCFECGAALSHRVVGGLCSVCALRGALTSRQEEVSDASTPVLAGPAVWPSGSAAGRTFGDYALLEEIGHGGMGVVYRARQLSLSRVVAVKVIRAERLAREEDVRRFRVEAAAAAQLQHPNIVAVHEAGEIAGRHCYSMDYVDGPSLAERLRSHPPSHLEAAGLVKTLAEAIQHAHEHGILHRDLKPSNVLIGGDGRPRVADFGLAKVLQDEPGVTRTGEVMGSPSYMAPEQAEGRTRAVDARTDVYALGAILYELLVGHPPFRAATSIESIRLMLETTPVSPRALDPRLPRDLETICLKCLEKSPARRYASARHLAEDLGRFLENKPIIARPVNPAEKLWRWCRRKPLAAGLGGGLLAAWLWNLTTAPLTPLLAGLAVGLVLAAWLGWQARRSARQLRQEKLQVAIETALGAAWGGDQAAAEEGIEQAVRYGASVEWVSMLNGQLALHQLRVEEAIRHLEQAVESAPGSLAAKAMLAAAYLYSGQLDHYAATLAEVLKQVGDRPPETALDCLCAGVALTAGYPDTAKAVTLLERAKQRRPSGVTFLQLGLAEAFHAADTGSWPTVRRALAHLESARELLSADHPLVRTAQLNACNFAIRLCPEQERTRVLDAAAQAARALERRKDPIGNMQRAFYFQLTGDDDAAVREWRTAVDRCGTGLFASWYAAAACGLNRAADALEVLARMESSVDSLTAVARAYLLLDRGLPDEAGKTYRDVAARPGFAQVMAETILLFAGEPEQVTANCVQLLQAVPAQHPEYQTLRYLAGQCSPEELVGSAGISQVQRGAAHYYIAMSCLAKGDRQAARHHFGQSVGTGTHWLLFFQWSRAFLARMDQDPRWPTWIRGETLQ